MSVLLAALSALSFGLGDFAGGFAARKSRVLSVLVVSQATGAILALFGVVCLGQSFPGARDILVSLIAGAVGLMGLLVLYRGIALTLVAVVSPLAALVSAALPLAFGLLRGEEPGPLATAGMLICLPAVVLLGWEKSDTSDRRKLRSSLIHGLVSGVGFGGFFIGLSLSSEDSGLWPVLAARCLSFAIVLAALCLGAMKSSGRGKASRRGDSGPSGAERALPRRGDEAFTLLKEIKAGLPWSLGAGAADIGGNILFLLASRAGLLSLSSVVSSLFPAPTVILARIVFKERLPALRVAGLVLAVAGVALMSLS